MCGASEPWSLIIAKFLGPGMVKQKLVAQLGLIIQEKTPSGSSAVATFPFLVPTLRRPGAARGLSRVFRGSPDPRDAVLLRGVSPPPRRTGACSQTRWSFAVTPPSSPCAPAAAPLETTACAAFPALPGLRADLRDLAQQWGERVCSFLWTPSGFSRSWERWLWSPSALGAGVPVTSATPACGCGCGTWNLCFPGVLNKEGNRGCFSRLWVALCFG